MEEATNSLQNVSLIWMVPFCYLNGIVSSEGSFYWDFFCRRSEFLLELRNIFLIDDRKFWEVSQSRQHISRLQKLVELTHSIFPYNIYHAFISRILNLLFCLGSAQDNCSQYLPWWTWLFLMNTRWLCFSRVWSRWMNSGSNEPAVSGLVVAITSPFLTSRREYRNMYSKTSKLNNWYPLWTFPLGL